jgi:hypothetical protein
MSQEIAKILMEEWLREWLASIPRLPPEEEWAWDPDVMRQQEMVEKFLKWLEVNK